jgi:hypothetical protein
MYSYSARNCSTDRETFSRWHMVVGCWHHCSVIFLSLLFETSRQILLLGGFYSLSRETALGLEKDGTFPSL